MERKNMSVELDQTNSDERTLSGYASTFGFPADRQGDVIAKGAFAETILNIKKNGIPLLDSHVQNGDSVIGSVIDAFEDEKGLFIKAKLADTPRVNELRAKMQQGHLNRMSIGFFVEAQHFKELDGETYRIITKADLVEISVVPIPANPRAEILAVKQAEVENKEITEEFKENLEQINEDHKEVLEKLDDNPVQESSCNCACEEAQEDGVRTEDEIQVTENTTPCQKEALELAAEALRQNIELTKRKFNHGK
jgi:HK97 family phage prohead protease